MGCSVAIIMFYFFMVKKSKTPIEFHIKVTVKSVLKLLSISDFWLEVICIKPTLLT